MFKMQNIILQRSTVELQQQQTSKQQTRKGNVARQLEKNNTIREDVGGRELGQNWVGGERAQVRFPWFLKYVFERQTNILLLYFIAVMKHFV